MHRLIAVWLLLAACGPELPPGGASTGSTSAGPSTTSAGSTSGGPSTSASPTTSGPEPVTTSEGPTSDATSSESVSTGVDSTGADTMGADTTGADTTGADTTGGPAGSCCFVPDAPSAKVLGTTPVEPVVLSWAWYSFTGGECGGLWEIHVYEDPAHIAAAGGPKLTIQIDVYDWPNDLVEGTGPAHFVYWPALGMGASIDGEITVTALADAHRPWWCEPGDPVVLTDARADLTFSLAGMGWQLDGELSAVYCPQLNVFCP